MRSCPETAPRRANPSDARTLAAMHVAAWHETYPGLVPDVMLAAVTVEARISMWEHILSDPSAGHRTRAWIVERAGSIVGFGSCGVQRTAGLSEQGFDGEIGAVYVLRSAQREGIGTALMRTMARDLQDHGHRAAGLWVLRENRPARRFYERLGGAAVMEREDHRADGVLTEVAYGWRNLGALARI